jgi:hypothetical protein
MKRTARYLVAAVILAFASSSAMAIQVFNTAGAEVGQFSKVKCGTNVTCTQVTGRLNIAVASTTPGVLQNRITTVSPTLTAAQCGSTVINTAASTAVLPEASTVLGCRFTFIVGNVSNFGINPADATDIIVLLTNAAGDSIIADAIGESVVLEAIGIDTWAPVGAVQGTWTDSN